MSFLTIRVLNAAITGPRFARQKDLTPKRLSPGSRSGFILIFDDPLVAIIHSLPRLLVPE